MTKHRDKRDDPEQSKRFIATAKEVEAEDEKALDRAFKKLSPAQRESKKRGESSQK